MMELELVSLNIGMPAIIGQEHGDDVWSGIAKRPVTEGSVLVRNFGISGDGQADLENHGGTDKAVYAYPTANWAWWQREYGLSCGPATFGENLTLTGADESDIRIGDRFAWGEVVLEVSQPRAPCSKLGLHTGRSEVPHWMTLAARCGWYLRVVREGVAPASGILTRVVESDSPSISEAFAAVFAAAPDSLLLQRIHGAPALSQAWRKRTAKKLRALGG
jgi:MOSC domain-containing protein YiiM